MGKAIILSKIGGHDFTIIDRLFKKTKAHKDMKTILTVRGKMKRVTQNHIVINLIDFDFEDI